MADSSPPAASGSPVEGFLTPRSKVAKMLADIDDEIDNAPTPSPSQKITASFKEHPSEVGSRSVSPHTPVPTFDLPRESRASHAISVDDESETESDGPDEAVRLPQGRAARRMLGTDDTAASTKSSPDRTSSANRSGPSHFQDNEDDLYSVTPMKQSKRAMPMATSPLDGEQVNGLFVSPTGPSPVGRERGNGLFVSPAKSTHADSEDDLPLNPFGGEDKLAELVAQKRAERLAKEAEQAERRKNASSADVSSDLPAEAFEGANEAVDPNIERIMSDATRPSRKASKKALLDMERETQRLAREQALAHQMKVKKKFTTNDLFAKFNFRQPPTNVATDLTNEVHSGDTTASSAPNSDGIEERTQQLASTPPSSPPTPLDKQKELVDQGALSKLMPVRQDSIANLAEIDDDEELPDISEVLKSSQRMKTAAGAHPVANEANEKRLRIARLGKKAVPKYDSSDDELDIVQNLPANLRAFEKVKGNTGAGKPLESRAIHNLKHLSHLHADDEPRRKKGAKPTISAKTLEMQLRKQAKEQARKQQFERIEELKAKGIDVQTADEREKEAEAFENLLEKARQDAVKLRKAEKAARKGAGVNEQIAEASDDEDEDEDFEYDGSGSEDEEMEEDDRPEQDEDELIDEAAEETDDEEDPDESENELSKHTEADLVVEDAEGEQADLSKDVQDYERELVTPAPRNRVSRKSRVIVNEDDESDADPEANDVTAVADVLEPEDDPFAAFNFGNADALLSPTQAFHATMETPTQATQEDSFDFLRRVEPPSAPSLPPSLADLDTQGADESQPGFVAGSQVPESQRISLNWETQPPETPAPLGLNRGTSALSETPGWEPSQDGGLPSPWSVGRRRASIVDSVDEHDTQSTVRLRISESPAPSQTAPRRGRLGRRQVAIGDSSDEDAPTASSKQERKDAFREMARRRKEALTATELAEANKEMRQMMDEQAEESEDEYAGLGGDDFVAPETEEDKEMIDSSHVEVDERALAAHFAERERIRNEEETSRLYKDLTTGVLRRKMGANAFDLEEDEDELAARRRQMRQQEEARKRKALLKDVNIATLADGMQSKGKDAFLKAIADDEGDEDIINISDGEEESVPATQEDTQASQSQQSSNEPLQEISGNKRVRPHDDDAEDRMPAKQRRTQSSAFRRPTSLLEVQESVSFLLEEPHAGPISEPKIFELDSDTESDYGGDISDDEELVAEESARNNDGGFAPNPASMDAKSMPPPRMPASQRRTAPKAAVIDRLFLKRVASASDSAHGRTAWAAGPTTGGFKVPSLLRRATTNIASGANERGVTTPPLSRENSGVKMGGSKKSSLAYQARAEERKAIVEASAKRREENTARIAQLRRNSSALNRGLTGRFE